MTMWYLIIPPFVIVLSLGGLLWFLSLRMNGTDIAEKLSSLRESSHGDARSRSLVRRAMVLKLLETMASKFKTGALRVHNFFQYSLEKVRRKRTEIDAMRKTLGAETRPAEPEKTEESAEFGNRKEDAVPVVLPAPSETTGVPVGPVSEGPATVFERPILRETIVRPDREPDRNRTGGALSTMGSREETLIARIVENPKDAAAYEELGDCYFSSENLQDAKECYRQTLKLHPTNRAVKVKIRRLQKMFEERAR